MHQDCSECQRLWREYGAATTSHIGLENKLKSLARVSDSARLEVAEAAKLRDSLRLAIRQHEAAIHGVAVNSVDLES